MQYAWPVACEFFPQLAKEHSVEEMYRALNVVTPSLIRVDADEVKANHLYYMYLQHAC
jgi:Zn-dependent M32 family carboxypeptidase